METINTVYPGIKKIKEEIMAAKEKVCIDISNEGKDEFLSKMDPLSIPSMETLHNLIKDWNNVIETFDSLADKLLTFKLNFEYVISKTEVTIKI